jgi:hypothetical protein
MAFSRESGWAQNALPVVILFMPVVMTLFPDGIALEQKISES